MSNTFDVIVVGAGPAGSTLAALLGAQGLRILLLDRATFPREKPCGEYMSPEALATLHRSGALPRVEALPHRKLVGHEIWSYDGSHLRGTYHAFGGYAPFRPYGIAVRRLLFDHELLRHAATFPRVTVRDGFRVDDLIRIGGRVVGVRGQGDSGPESFAAPLTVGADGVNSVVARCLGLTRQDPDVRRCAMVAYFRGMDIGDYGEVHLGEPGYFAMAPVDDELTNINFVVDGANLRGARGDAESFYMSALSRNPRLAGRLRRAERVGPVRVTGPMARRNRGTVAPGALLVGDAAEFVDPVTGEGIFIALRSAELAAEVIAPALAAGDPGTPLLEEFHRRREAEFGERLRSCWRVQRYLYRPWITNYVVRTLGAKPELADRVIGMSGDYIPPEAVFNLSFLLRFINPFHHRRAAAMPAG
ncbi:MAG: NAD(P)/FAD-dependent oxidoreductase [Planctomycetes bacterium]|nr:NAD(P)/FAD-dependent oxidoreductase [Planctomycetota bacterium]